MGTNFYLRRGPDLTEQSISKQLPYKLQFILKQADTIWVGYFLVNTDPQW